MHGLSGMNIKTKLLPLLIATATLTVAGCDSASESPFSPGGGSSGLPISDKNFNLFFDPIDPEVITDEGFYGDIEVTLIAKAGDKFNSAVSGGTVRFVTEWGVLDENSCQLVQGTCSVTWRSNSDPGFLPFDLRTAIVAYTYGEESYLDLNGNGTFEDGDYFLRDIPEPFLDRDRSLDYTDTVDQIIDTDNNGVHTPADGMFNGSGCAHSTLCGTPSRIIIWDGIFLNLDQSTEDTTVLSVTIDNPADNFTTTSGTNINFTATATDPEDGEILGTDNPVAGNGIEWVSDQDGVIGDTNNFNTNSLTVNTHVITVTVTDSDANTATDSITVVVDP